MHDSGYKLKKKCSKCDVVKDLTCFHINSGCIDGRAGSCKLCTKKAYHNRVNVKILPIVLKVLAYDREHDTNLVESVMRVTLNAKVRAYAT